MNWHKFIFSEKISDRIERHVVFWLLWWIYFAATYYYYVQVGLQEITFGSIGGMLIIKTFLLLLVHIASCYIFIYTLLPVYLQRQDYFFIGVTMLMLMAALIVSGYLIHAHVFPLIDAAYKYDLASANNTIWWTSINSVLLNAPKIIAAATAIKLVKRWYLKQKEKERIEQEKLATDLELLKAQMRPDFLFSSLEQIYRYAERRSPEAPELLLKFSDLLSCMLYECDDLRIALEKEVTMTREYMRLGRMRHKNEIEMEIVMRGDMYGREIAPLILLPFIENSFRQSVAVAEQPWINLDISVEEDLLTMKLTNGVDAESAAKDAEYKTTEIINIERRLNLLYEDNHEVKMYADGEIFITVLKINLDRKPYGLPFDLSNKEALVKYAVN